MVLEWIGMVFFIVGVCLLWSAPERLLGLQIIACVFAGSAAISLPAVGGATVAPALATLLILMFCVLKFGHLNNLFSAMAPGQAGFWLLMVLVWSVFSAIAMPRIFEGDVIVISMNRASMIPGQLIPLEALKPGSGNITQTTYIAGELFVFAVALIFLRLEGGLELATRAILWLAGLNLLAAGIDLFGYYSGLGNLLEPLQTANYAFMPEASFGSIKRINGTFPEASAFAGFTLPVFAFCYILYREKLWPRISGALALGNLAALLLATSSAGYGGLAVYGALVLLGSFISGFRRGGKTYLGHYVLLITCGLLAVLALLALMPSVREQAWSIFEDTLLYKSETASAIERGDWNNVSWHAFLDTWGLGTGLGSARASSLPMVLVSNLGLPGSLLFLAFLWRVLFGRLPDELDKTHRNIIKAARHAIMAALVLASLVASVFDLGVLFYILCAISCSPALLYRPEHNAPPPLQHPLAKRVMA